MDLKSNDSKLQKYEVKNNYLFVWEEGKQILYYQQAVGGLEIEIDYPHYREKLRKNWEAVSTIKSKQVILDASNSFYVNRDLMGSTPDSLKVYSVLEKGAWLEKFGE